MVFAHHKGANPTNRPPVPPPRQIGQGASVLPGAAGGSLLVTQYMMFFRAISVTSCSQFCLCLTCFLGDRMQEMLFQPAEGERGEIFSRVPTVLDSGRIVRFRRKIREFSHGSSRGNTQGPETQEHHRG